MERYRKRKIIEAIPAAIELVKNNFRSICAERYQHKGEIYISPRHSVQWSIFLYSLSRVLYLSGSLLEADSVYYLNKIMNSIDWFYQVKLPIHFCAEHPIGSILGKATYGDYLFVYQGTTVGGNPNKDGFIYPDLGNNIILCANSTILGDTHIGNNVIISANTYLINEVIPDNCIVFGKSPKIVIKQYSKKEMMYKISQLFKWEYIL